MAKSLIYPTMTFVSLPKLDTEAEQLVSHILEREGMADVRGAAQAIAWKVSAGENDEQQGRRQRHPVNTQHLVPVDPFE